MDTGTMRSGGDGAMLFVEEPPVPRAVLEALPVVVRDAVPEDCERFAAIYDEAIASGRSTMDTEPADAAAFRARLAALSPRECLLAAVDASGEVVAWGTVKHYSDRPGYRFACETSVYVAADATGGGIGSEVQRALLERARGFGYRHVVAKIIAHNEGSLRFHERFGYTRVGVQEGIGFLDGRWTDVAILQCLLDDEETPACR